MKKSSELKTLYAEIFKEEPSNLYIGYAPGRVEILGNHTDYNKGFVLTAAIDQKTYCFGTLRDDEKVIIHALDIGEAIEFNINNPPLQEKGHWGNYFIGVLNIIKEKSSILKGFQIAITSEVPMSAGCSSSASIEASFAYFLNETNQLHLNKQEIAQICQKAENEYAGVMCGLMDQWSVVHGQKNNLVYFDNDTLKTNLMSLGEEDIFMLVFNTQIKHTLIDSKYNDRREECQKVVDECKKRGFNIDSLRGLSIKDLPSINKFLNSTIYRRAKHVIEENHRIQTLVDASYENQPQLLKSFMLDSHHSSKDQFENSCPELDFVVDQLYLEKGCLGAKLSGGGFGGCVVALVNPNEAENIQATIEKAYIEKFPDLKPLDTIQTLPGDGAGFIETK
ncbi:MAG: galactokinase [Planctomycetota bacterium]|nr:MAG: galactokinase [Planctomycetota bacterium]